MSTDTQLPNELRQVLEEYVTPVDPITPEGAVEKFIAGEKGDLAPNTVDEYERKLEWLIDFCELNSIEDTSEFDASMLHDYRIWRRDETNVRGGSLSRKTMKDDMYVLRKFLRFLEGINAVNPGLHETVEIPSLKPGEGVRDDELPSERVESILNYLQKYEYATREHAVWVLLAATGRRPGGLRSLDCEDMHLDTERPYIEFENREEDGTRLKNGDKSDTMVALRDKPAEILRDYLETNRVDIEDENGRSPVLSSPYGRLATSTIRNYVYKWSRPCMIGEDCPIDRDPSECQAMESTDHASKCPSSKPPYALRHGYISDLRRRGVSISTISDRVDASEKIIKEVYSELTEEEKLELRRAELEANSDATGGYL